MRWQSGTLPAVPGHRRQIASFYGEKLAGKDEGWRMGSRAALCKPPSPHPPLFSQTPSAPGQWEKGGYEARASVGKAGGMLH